MVRNRCHDQDLLLSQLKWLIAGMFRADMLEPDRMGDSLCLDSLDLLELAICIEEEFGVAILCAEESQSAFTSIASLADFVHARAGQSCSTVTHAGGRTAPAFDE
jgi:acyl carrier protein